MNKSQFPFTPDGLVKSRTVQCQSAIMEGNKKDNLVRNGKSGHKASLHRLCGIIDQSLFHFLNARINHSLEIFPVPFFRLYCAFDCGLPSSTHCPRFQTRPAVSSDPLLIRPLLLRSLARLNLRRLSTWN
jgi:hypothetical protein